MTRSSFLASVVAAFAFGLAGSAQAAPVSGVADLKIGSSENAGVEQVRHRCYRHRGHWHCPRHHHYYGYRPGFHLHIGPRRHHHHYRRHRHY